MSIKKPPSTNPIVVEVKRLAEEGAQAAYDARNWAEKLLDEYKAGASDVEVAAVLNISMATFERQYKENDTYKQLVDLGRLLSSAWWLKQGRTNLTNKMFNTALWSFNMKNRQGWAERSESVNQEMPAEYANLDDLRTKLAAKADILRKLGNTEAVVLEKTSTEDSNGPH